MHVVGNWVIVLSWVDESWDHCWSSTALETKVFVFVIELLSESTSFRKVNRNLDVFEQCRNWIASRLVTQHNLKLLPQNLPIVIFRDHILRVFYILTTSLQLAYQLARDLYTIWRLLNPAFFQSPDLLYQPWVLFVHLIKINFFLVFETQCLCTCTHLLCSEIRNL